MKLGRIGVIATTALAAAALMGCGPSQAKWTLLFHAAPHADTFPSRPIFIVVPFDAGTGADLITRIVGRRLGKALGQPVIVQNKPGANGVIGAMDVARAAPDGYTILLGTNTSMSAAPGLNRTVPYDPVKDFIPVSRLGSFTQLLLVNPSLPIRSMPELIAYARAHPGKLSYASGNASAWVAGETLKRVTGIDMLHVPYKTSGPAIEDVLGGRVSMVFTEAATGLPLYRSGALRALATTRLTRSRLVPELPTFDESGVSGFEMDSWAGFFVPAHTPEPIVNRLNAALQKVIDAPDTRRELAGDTSFDAFSSSVQELDAFNRAQLVKWTRMIQDAGIQPQ